MTTVTQKRGGSPAHTRPTLSLAKARVESVIQRFGIKAILHERQNSPMLDKPKKPQSKTKSKSQGKPQDKPQEKPQSKPWQISKTAMRQIDVRLLVSTMQATTVAGQPDQLVRAQALLLLEGTPDARLKDALLVFDDRHWQIDNYVLLSSGRVRHVFQLVLVQVPTL